MTELPRQALTDIFHAALAVGGVERERLLAEACGGDTGLRRELDSLLAHASAVDRTLDIPAMARATPLGARGSLAGIRIGVYEIGDVLGAGGMGEVYRARDTRLGREVAIKVLPPDVTADPDRLARFRREARMLAALTHPNIAAIYELAETGKTTAIVMELVDGPSLAQRLSRGPLPVDEAVAIAMQIADALDAAHEKGIVHRDLKPANVLITHSGVVKVLDFGLAKSLEAPADTDTTVTNLQTTQGAILGTAPYMSPEQVRGRHVDKRTDIWAFGCVLYELLTGQRAFIGETTAETIARILEREPEWDAIPLTSPAVRRVLRRCLEKDPRRRLRDIGDARAELGEATAAPSSVESTTPPTAVGLDGAWWKIAGAVVALSVLATAVLTWRDRPVPPEATRLSLSAPGQFFATPPSAVISPDGRQIALVSADSSGKDMLWVQALASQAARLLAGTERADLPFWSPDSRSIGFFADGKLKRVDAAGGSVQVITSAPVSPGATWNQDGIILFAKAGEGLSTVSAAGGTASLVMRPPPGTGVVWPHFLPDGRHFLYFMQSSRPDVQGVYVGSLDTKETKHLMYGEVEAAYAPPGYLLFVRNEALMAQPFDAKRLELTGEPALLAEGAWMAKGYGHGVFSASANGVVTYVNAAIADTQLAWFDRGGRPLGLVGPPARYDSPPQLSPSGESIAVARGPYASQDVWLLNPPQGADNRLTFDSAGSRVPVWFRDGSHLAFQSSRGGGAARLYEKSSTGVGSDELLSDLSSVNLQDISPDGRLLAYMKVGAGGHFELWVLPLSGDDRTPVPYLQTASNNGQAQISPDGRWLAYTSNESGRDEVYVQSFPKAGSKRQISTDGGAQARWRRNGRELFYLATDQVLMAAPVTDGVLLQVGRPAALFRTRLDFLGLQGPYFMPGYDVTPDGQRFILNAPPEQLVPPITVLLNWTAALKK